MRPNSSMLFGRISVSMEQPRANLGRRRGRKGGAPGNREGASEHGKIIEKIMSKVY